MTKNEAASVAALDQAVEAWYDAQDDTNGMDWTDESRYRMQAAIDAYEAHAPQAASVAQLTDEQLRAITDEAMTDGRNYSRQCLADVVAQRTQRKVLASLAWTQGRRDALQWAVDAAVGAGFKQAENELRALLAQAAPPAAPAQKCASCGQMPKALCCEVLAAPVAPASNHRPDRQWYESKIKETLNDDFEIGSVERSCGKCGRKLMRYELTCLHCKPMNTAPPADEASATIAGMRVVVDPRLAPCEFEIRASAQQDEPCGVCEETGYVAEDTRCPNCNPESAQQDERKCTCGSGPGGGHSRTCQMFDESMMRYDPFGLAAQQDEREAVTDAMVYAFHRSMSDGSLGEADFNEIRDGLLAALIAAPQIQATGEPIYQWRGSSDAWIDCDAAKYAEVGHGIANAKPGTYGSSWERRIVYAAQQVQAGGEDKQDAARYRWLVENAKIETDTFFHDGKDPASTKQPLDNAIDAAMSREQPQPSNGDREGGAK